MCLSHLLWDRHLLPLLFSRCTLSCRMKGGYAGMMDNEKVEVAHIRVNRVSWLPLGKTFAVFCGGHKYHACFGTKCVSGNGVLWPFVVWA